MASHYANKRNAKRNGYRGPKTLHGKAGVYVHSWFKSLNEHIGTFPTHEERSTYATWSAECYSKAIRTVPLYFCLNYFNGYFFLL